MSPNRSCKLVFNIVTLLLCGLFVAALSAGNPTDFPISTEPTPSLFVQQEPRLFPTPDGGFVIAWKDYRLGELSYFAQRFDSTGTPVGKNFQVVGNTDMAFSPDGTGMAISLNRDFSQFSSGSLCLVHGQLLSSTGSALTPFLIDNAIFPPNASGFWGLGAKVIATSDGFLFAFNFGGHISLKKYDSKGRIIFDSEDSLRLPETVMTFSLAANARGQYVLLWSNSVPERLPIGIYATFFSPSNSVVADTVLVQACALSYRQYEQRQQVHAVSVADTTFEFFWADADSMIVKDTIYAPNGQVIQPVTLIGQMPPIVGYSQKIVNFAFTNLRYDKFASLTTASQYIPIPTMPDYPLYNVMLNWFDHEGTPLTSSQCHDLGRFPILGDHLAQTFPNVLACPVESSGDVFYSKMQDSIWLDSLRVNDDVRGANQASARVIAMGNQSFFVSWQDEHGYHGRSIDLQGNLLGEEALLSGREVLFFPEDKAVNIWSKRLKQERDISGMTIYNSNTWKAVLQDTVRQGTWLVTSLPLSDSTFVVLVQQDAYRLKRLHLACYTSDGLKIKEETVTTEPGSGFDNLLLIRNDPKSFWVIWRMSARLYSTGLELQSSTFSLPYGEGLLYIGRGHFLIVSTSYQPTGKYATIIDTTGVQQARFLLVDDSLTTNITLTLLDSAKFLAMWTVDKDIYARTFSTNGQPVTDKIKIHTDVDAKRDWLSAAVNNDKVLFVWSDTRNYGQGYDLYGSIHDLDVITGVQSAGEESEMPSNFSLLHNYPNPFNASTLIRYRIPAQAFVTLEIFNLQGQRVRRLIDAPQAAGNHQAVWDGRDDSAIALPTGVYFVRLSAGDQMLTNKAILMR